MQQGSDFDVAAWLGNLGLKQYSKAFEQNDIDHEVLTTMTEDDLRELGVNSLGHRKKLLIAIAALRDAQPTAQPAAASKATETSSTVLAERRHLTVMFVDLVGSTQLASGLDPEDLREVMDTCQRCISVAIERFGGFVAQYLGDGVLAYFGYPRAHEDDAERAIRAGLAAVETVSTLRPLESYTPQLRIGIATGVVVVGHVLEAGDATERGVAGETPNLAARLQAVATPNAIVIADRTRRLVGSLFRYEDLGALQIKGFREPLRAWRVLEESDVEGRFAAHHAEASDLAALGSLVGREEQMELLLRRWQEARRGSARVVLLAGEPGIGKSRILESFSKRIGDEHIRLRYFCSPHHQNDALHPIVAHLRHAAGLRRDDGPGRPA